MAQPKMSGAVTHPLVQKIINYQTAVAKGEFGEARQVFQPDVEYIVPGRNVFSGTHRGADEVIGYFGKLMEITGGSYEIVQMNWLVCGDKILLETKNAAHIKDVKLEWDEALLFEFRDGKKAKIEMFQAEQEKVNAFFGNE